jgi:hypothetical protein
MNLTPDELAELIVVTIKRAIGGPKVHDRFVAVEARLATLEAARPAAGVEYAGVHEVGKAYNSGVLVTKKGALWLSLRDTTQTPGMDPVSWKLVVKSGQAGDAR